MNVRDGEGDSIRDYMKDYGNYERRWKLLLRI
jgi:hypothetical protein